ncbi:thioesterase family protein [Salinibacterium sp. SYSU T00001]|uniref:thioesterase family protein n=1 Tax=Homoserinimonas sedimenticola TaxID=2986805 RepID=UPI0022366C3D|nr:thioesterase family protein [Salinibacterium sedimenticola]MCW4385857.1 thioesterase family protein [Salinibacterium sedimenticola]
MNLIWRTLTHLLVASRAKRVDVFDVVRSRFRVLPTDLDVNRHMNNGRYLSIADVARFEMLMRTGVWKVLMSNGWYPVVQSSTITHRLSLTPWQRFTIESRIMAFDEKSVYLEHRFVVKGQLAARLVLRGRFLKRSGGTVPLAEISKAVGVDVSDRSVPEWVQRWAADVTLPSTRQPTPSVWED